MVLEGFISLTADNGNGCEDLRIFAVEPHAEKNCHGNNGKMLGDFHLISFL